MTQHEKQIKYLNDKLLKVINERDALLEALFRQQMFGYDATVCCKSKIIQYAIERGFNENY